MAGILELPKLEGIDADHSIRHVKLARILRGKIESGECHQGDILAAADLAHEYHVPIRVTYSTLTMLAADRYVSRPVTSCPAASSGRRRDDGRKAAPRR